MIHDTYSTRVQRPIFLGDINVHYNSLTDRTSTLVRSILEERQLVQHINVPTHKKNNTLDWIISDNNSTVNNIQVADKLISDHYVITFEMDIKKPQDSKSRTITSRNIRAINENDFKRDLELVVPVISNSMNKATTYNNELCKVLDKHAPLRKRKITPRPSAPWMAMDIKAAKIKRRRAEKQWRRTKLTVHRQIYQHANNNVNSLITKAKYKLYNKQISECSTSKQLFMITKSLSNDTCLKESCTNVSDMETANNFGSYFKNKIATIRGNLDKIQADPPTYESFTKTSMTNFKPVTVQTVIDIIKSSPPKSCCLDPIPTNILVNNIECLSNVVTDIINESLISGTVPPMFKQAVVVPLLKKVNLPADDMKNFRPVSNLPFLSKILEKVVLCQLNEHLKNNELNNVFQSAYKKFHNTETALLKVTNDLLCAADDGNISILALLDLSAAFDTIDHTIMIERLHKTFGIAGTVLEWFKSYLCHRSQSVIYNGTISTPFGLEFGVPQGSVLGPVLYILYTQPLSSVINNNINVHFHFYADDTQIYTSGPPSKFQELRSSITDCSRDIKDWMVRNKLKMNEDKTETLFIGIKNDHTAIDIAGECITPSENARNLGVYFDQHLSFQSHINKLCQILYLELRRIGKLSNFLNQNSLKILISSYFLSRLDYCNSLLVALPEVRLKKLQRFQNQAARIVLKRRARDHVTPMLAELHWLPVSRRIDYKIAVLCFKCLNKTAPQYLYELLEPYVPTRQLRSTNLNLIRARSFKTKNWGGRSFTSFAQNLWNSLPQSLRNVTDEVEFRRKLKTHLFC